MIICAKFYQNRLGFVDDVIKTYYFIIGLIFFRFTVPINVHLQNTNAKYEKVV